MHKLMFFCLLAFSVHAFAADKDRPLRPGHRGLRGNEHSVSVTALTVGAPTYGGNACPQGTLRVAFAPDNLSFSLLFDQFVAQIPSAGAGNHDRMACDAVIPLEIPNGMQMEITRVDFRGFVALPERATAGLNSVFNFRGRGGDKDRINLHFDFQGPVMDNYELSSDVMNSQSADVTSEVSPCGGYSTLVIKTQLHLMAKQQASVTVDSIDGGAHAVYYLNWRTCK